VSFPSHHLHNENDNNAPIPFHIGQKLAFDCAMRYIIMAAGSQSGKTSFAPHWLKAEIDKRGPGDYIAVTSTYDLFKLKMLPSIQTVFCDIYKIGRYWTGNRIIEICNPETGEFLAKRSDDRMWARIILRSADALSGLESATAKAAWLDEIGQTAFTFNAYKAIQRRLTLNLGRILMTTTLYDIDWFTEKILDVALEGGKVQRFTGNNNSVIEYTENTVKNTGVIQMDSTVNPMFDVSEFAAQKELLDDNEFEMFFRGRKGDRKFQIYSSFDQFKHTCPRFEIPKGWTRYVGVDFGGVNMAGVFFAEEPETDTLYCYKTYLQGDCTIEEHVKNMLDGEVGKPIAYGGAKSEDQWRKEFSKNGLPLRSPAVSEVEIGIARVFAQHRLNKIIYFDDLKDMLREKVMYKRVKGEDGKPTKEIEDKSKFHLLDCERYIISSIRTRIVGKGYAKTITIYPS
jgi:hypothetical protein